MDRLSMVLVSLLIAQTANAQMPEFYNKVDRLIWIVDDLERVVRGWKGLGFEQIRDFGEIDLSSEQYRGRPARGRLKVAGARLGSAQIRWLQPIGGENAYTDFLAQHGSGVFSLVHRVPTREALDAEVRRLEGLGVRVLERGGVEGTVGSLSYAYMDTEKDGKYVLGLICVGDSKGSDLPEQAPLGLKLSQYAFTVRDPRPVSAYWKRLGFPEMTYTHGGLRDLMYNGKPAEYDMELGWQRHGTIVYEWILPLKGPMNYLDHMKTHGEGFHHLAFDTDDIDNAAAHWRANGYPTVMSGAWGEEGKPGSGRFAYSDTDSIGGVKVEFLWNYR
jgi:hypothetical protein